MYNFLYMKQKTCNCFSLLFIFIIFFEIMLFLFKSECHAANNYYVDNIYGNDTYTGLSQATPWKTIAKVNSSNFGPNDSILFKQGNVWQEQLNIPSSGLQGYPITFGAYGTGNKPILTAYDTITGWTPLVVSGYATDPNIQAYYYLDETNGTRYDGTSNLNNLADSNTVTYSVTHQQGLYSSLFTAANYEYLSRTDASLSAHFPGKNGSYETAVTFGAWVMANTLGSMNRGIIGKGTWIDGNSYSLLWNKNGYFEFLINDHGTARYIDANTATYNPGQWYFVVCRMQKNGACNIFVNGVKQADTENYSNNYIAGGTGNFTIGRDLTWNGYWDGIIDMAFVFNRALSDSEIANIYNNGFGGSIFYKSVSVRPTRVTYDGIELTEVSALAALTTGKFYWSGPLLFIYDNPTGHTIEAIQRTSGINLNGKDYVTINGIEVKGGQLTNLNDNYSPGGCITIPMTSNNVTIQNCTLSLAQNAGVQINASSYVTVDHCDISNINAWDPNHAVAGWTFGDGITVQAQNWFNPVPNQPDHVTLTYNTIHDKIIRQGIAIVSGTNIQVANNTITAGQVGIDLEPTDSKLFVDGVTISYNTITKSTVIMGPNPNGKLYNDGIDVTGTCKNITVDHNNIDLGGTVPK